MKEVKNVENLDKHMKGLSKKINFGIIGGCTLGVLLSALITYLANMSNVAMVLASIGGVSGLALTGRYSFEKFNEYKLEKSLDEIKTQTGIDIDIEEAKKALEKTDVNTRNSYDSEKTHSITEKEVIKRYFMLDKKEQLQVLEFARKCVSDSMGKTATQSLNIFEEEDKKAIDYVGEKKELKFIPKMRKLKKD